MNVVALLKAISSTALVFGVLLLTVFMAKNYGLYLIGAAIVTIVIGLFVILTVAFYDKYRKY